MFFSGQWKTELKDLFWWIKKVCVLKSDPHKLCDVGQVIESLWVSTHLEIGNNAHTYS